MADEKEKNEVFGWVKARGKCRWKPAMKTDDGEVKSLTPSKRTLKDNVGFVENTPTKIKCSLGKGGVADSYMQMVKEAKLAATEVESYYPSITLHYLFQVHDYIYLCFIVPVIGGGETGEGHGRRGVNLFLGWTGNDLWPVGAILNFLVARGPQSGPLFAFADGRLLTRRRCVEAVKGALTAAGIDERRYNGHSFRIGAATTAAAKGIEDSIIKTLGRWESVAYQQYVRIPRSQLTRYSSLLVSP